jgi:hypothetical protein
MKITKDQAEIMLQKMPEMAEKIYEDFPELKTLKGVDSWEDLSRIDGYFINGNAEIENAKSSYELSAITENKNIFKTQKQAESALAYAQLTQLMADCGDCEIDWIKHNLKYIIRRKCDFIDKVTNSYTFNNFHVLAFNTEKIRDEFLEKHEGLIKTFYQL